MLIEDGTGSGKTVAVNEKNRLKTATVQSSIEHTTNHEEGLAFNLILQQTPTYDDPSNNTEDICIGYIKNTNELDMCLEGIHFRLNGTGQSTVMKIKGNDSGTPVGGTTNTPANLNLGSGNIADGIFLTGHDITGLSGGTVIEKIYISSSDTTSTFNFSQDIIVSKNKIVTIYSSNEGTEIDIMLIFNYHNIETAG